MRWLVLAFAWCVLLLANAKVGANAPQPSKKKENVDPADYNTFGTLWLDSVSWDKVFPNMMAHTLVMVCSKGALVQTANDLIRNEFLRTARDSVNPDLLFAQVMVNGAENSILASQKLGIENTSRIAHPYFFLIKKGEVKGIPIHSGTTSGAIRVSDVLHGVSKHTGLLMHLPGTSPELNELAAKFNAPGVSTESRKDILNRALQFLKEQSTASGASEWSVYTKAMEKILEKGDDWVEVEKRRMQDILLSEKVSDSRKVEFRRRLNMLHSFIPRIALAPEAVTEAVAKEEKLAESAASKAPTELGDFKFVDGVAIE